MSSNEAADPPSHTRLIVVEDSFAVADGLKFMLETGGYEVVGMAGNVRTALQLVATAAFDLALLDIDLRGEPVTAVAEAVQKLGKPMIFLSGYGDAEVLPAHLRRLARLEKPVDGSELFAALGRMLTGTAAE